MIDTKTIERIQLLHPKLRKEAEDIYKEITEALTGSAMCRFSYTLRTFYEQNELYSYGRTKQGNKVTNAKGGYSYHNYGLALDIVLIDNNIAEWDIKKDYDKDSISDWMEVVHIFKSFGWEWGGDWKFTDNPHFQKTFGYPIRQLLEMYNSNKVDKNNYVLI
jgi:peptidoglycan L-alanyl-D-glutamate endopeptidase CwlK